MTVLAVDVALLPPPEVRDLAIRLSGGLPRAASKGLVLDEHRLPHITLTQQFVDAADIDGVLTAVEVALADVAPMRLHVPGGGRSRRTVWMTVERSPALVALHERLMNALQPFERTNGGPGAFHGGDARSGDVQWVSSY